MAFSVSNEFKVGALTAVSITLLILGFNFMKGKNPLKRSDYFLIKFRKIEGIEPANAVKMSGLTVGNVYKTEPLDENMSGVLVTIRLTEEINIPNNSYASIKGSLLGMPAIEIVRGTATTYLQKGDTINSAETAGLVDGIMEKVEPTRQYLNGALTQLDTVLRGVNNLLDDKARQDLKITMANLALITANLAKTTESVQELMKSQGPMVKTMQNFERFSNQLEATGEKFPAITANLEKTTQQLSKLDLDKTLQSLQQTLAQTEGILTKISSSNGSIGALINEKKLYNNLTSTVNSLNLLLQDFRLHPKRYVNVSVFGKKDKGTPIMRPMDEDSLTQEQLQPKRN